MIELVNHKNVKTGRESVLLTKPALKIACTNPPVTQPAHLAPIPPDIQSQTSN